MNTPLEVARAHWGEELPDWIAVLARECTASSQSRVAKRLERSAAMISQVLRAKYPGDLRAIEDLVRGQLMAQTVTCPALGELPLHECRGWMAKARDFHNTNSLRIRMYRACRRCPRYRDATTGAPRPPVTEGDA